MTEKDRSQDILSIFEAEERNNPVTAAVKGFASLLSSGAMILTKTPSEMGYAHYSITFPPASQSQPGNRTARQIFVTLLQACDENMSHTNIPSAKNLHPERQELITSLNIICRLGHDSPGTLRVREYSPLANELERITANRKADAAIASAQGRVIRSREESPGKGIS